MYNFMNIHVATAPTGMYQSDWNTRSKTESVLPQDNKDPVELFDYLKSLHSLQIQLQYYRMQQLLPPFCC